MGEVAVFVPRHAARGSLMLAVDLIEEGQRLRPVDPDWAAAIAVSVERDGGLIHPIEVRPLPGGRHRLVVGAHRLAAFRQRGWEAIETFTFTGDALAAKAREIAENVMRRTLSPLDRAAFVAELYEVEKARAGWEEGQSQQAFAANKRWAKDTGDMMSAASGLTDAVATKVGLVSRTIERDLQLFRGLDPRARALLADHPVRENAAQLRLLARQPDQLKIVRWLVSGEVKTVGEAIARLSPRAPADPADKRLSAVIGAFSRASERERKTLMLALREHGLLPRDEEPARG